MCVRFARGDHARFFDDAVDDLSAAFPQLVVEKEPNKKNGEQDTDEREQRKVKEFISHFKSKIDEYDDLVTGNVIFQNRTKGVGYISREDAISYGMSGPSARASGVSCDIRKLYPYEQYDKVQFTEIIETGGDSFARYLVRMKEMRESLS